MMKKLKQEMRKYYQTKWPEYDNKDQPDFKNFKISLKIQQSMEKYVAENPDTHPCLIKAKLHETIADLFEPEIFTHSPFFFEMGVRHSPNWGTPMVAFHAGGWMFRRYQHLFAEVDPAQDKLMQARKQLGVEVANHYVDYDHHSLGYTKVLKVGIKGLMDEALDQLKKCQNDQEKSFIDATLRSMHAVLKIAAKFADKAKKLITEADDVMARNFLIKIAETAQNIPRHPPKTFYEGLAAIWFLREVTASIEGIGISIVGHPDRVLADLYHHDIKNGRITRKEAVDLVGRWMLPTDIKFDLENNRWPETSTTLTLGGCDRDGSPVYNEVTKIFLESHFKYKLINPKLNCRFNKNTPPEFLQEISRQILAGHNVYAILNDDCLIPANVKTGKKLADCRLYGAGGCQETVVEGVEHSAGAYYYFNMPRVLDLCLHSHSEFRNLYRKLKIRPSGTVIADSFAKCYENVIGIIGKFISQGAEIRKNLGTIWDQVSPAPFFSTTLDDCLLNRKDYTGGGARYNPGGISLVGFGTLVDSLYSIKVACFDEKWLTVKKLINVLKDNWIHNEPLRQRFINLPKYGHNHREVDALAVQIANDIRKICKRLKNERGGIFQPSFFVYYAFVNLAKNTLSTPDGRKDGEMYSQGIAPGRLKPANSITETFKTLGKIDFTGYPGNAVMDAQLPMGKMNSEILASLIQTFGQLNAPTLQCNSVNIKTLQDAQKHPEKHQDLVVRISGLSAKFVCLDKSVQDEIISRNIFT